MHVNMLDPAEAERVKVLWEQHTHPLFLVKSSVRPETELREQLDKYQRQAKVYAERQDPMEAVACSLVASVLAYTLSQTSEPCALFKMGDW